MIGLIASDFTGVSVLIDALPATNAITAAIGGIGIGGTSSSSRPAAYLNFYLFDNNLNFIPEGSGFMSTIDGNQGLMDQFSHNLTIKKAGYILVFLSNESEAPIVHTK